MLRTITLTRNAGSLSAGHDQKQYIMENQKYKKSLVSLEGIIAGNVIF